MRISDTNTTALEGTETDVIGRSNIQSDPGSEGTRFSIDFMRSMGVTPGPCVFLEALDDNLWERWWSGAQHRWLWEPHGRPPGGVVIGPSMGAFREQKYEGVYYHYVFLRGSDGNLWARWWDGSHWYWKNHSTPGHGLEKSMGVAEGNEFLRGSVFVRGSDGNLWEKPADGSNSTPWYNRGAPGVAGMPRVGIAASMGAIRISHNRYQSSDGLRGVFVYVRGDDGNLWELRHVIPFSRDGHDDGIWEWANRGRPSMPGNPGVEIKASMGMVRVPYSLPSVFVLGGDGNLWCSRDGWEPHGTPPGVVIKASMGAVFSPVEGSAYNRYYVFVLGSDGNLWVRHYQVGWSWINLGNPPGSVTISGTMGACIHAYTPRVFVRGNDGNLWVCWFTEGVGWDWTNLGHP